MTCGQCGVGFTVPAYRRETVKYCSRRCLALAARDFGTADCATCGMPFDFISSRSNRAKYCSRACYYKAMHTKGSVTCRCKHCGKIFLASPSERRVYCSRACVNKVRMSRWVPHKSTLRKGLMKRGAFTECGRCGWAKLPSLLGVHHKDRDHKNNRPENIEILCPNCHSEEHMKHVVHGFRS